MEDKTLLYKKWLEGLKASLDSQDIETAQMTAANISKELFSDYDKNSPISIISLNEIADYILKHLTDSPNDTESYHEILKFYEEIKS